MSFPNRGLVAVPYCFSHPPPASSTCALTECPPPQRATGILSDALGGGRYAS